ALRDDSFAGAARSRRWPSAAPGGRASRPWSWASRPLVRPDSLQQVGVAAINETQFWTAARMIPLVDIHCHLLAGLDDGPRTREDAVAMCRMAHEEGVRLMAATAHQSKRWPLTPQTILGAGRILEEDLRTAGIALEVFPSAEVMAEPETADHWQAGK